VKLGEAKVTLMPNGAFVASRDGVQFLDGGLGFAAKGHQRWGEQIRGSKPQDTFRVAPTEGASQALCFSGEIRDTHGKAALRFDQRVMARGTALRFEYALTPTESIAHDRLGLTFHLPTRHSASQVVECSPGFREVRLPLHFHRGRSKGYLGQWVARRLLIGRGSCSEAVLSLDAPGEWMLFDDRAWELNTFRLWLNRRVPKGQIAESGPSFAFELSFAALAPCATQAPDITPRIGLEAGAGRAPSPTKPSEEAITRSGVTFRPDGSFSIWRGGRRVAEAGLLLLAPKVKYDPKGPDREIAILGPPKWIKPGKELTDVRTRQWDYARPDASEPEQDRAALSFTGVLPQSLWDIPLTCLGDVAPVRDGLHVGYRQQVTERADGHLIVSYELRPSPALMAQLRKSLDVFQPGLAVHIDSGASGKPPKATTRRTQLDLSWGDLGAAQFSCPGISKWTAAPKGQTKHFHALFDWPRSKQQARRPADRAKPQTKGKSKASKPQPADRLTFELGLSLPLPPAAVASAQKPTRRSPERAAATTDQSSKTVVILPDDTVTRGDWQGKYGAHTYILCGRYSPRSLEGGPGWPIRYRIYTGNSDDPARQWLSSLDASRFQSALWNPIEQNRQFSVWDDHGEVYPRGKGPDLFIDLEIPKGQFCFGLYFMESDWIQYRAHTISITKKGTKKTLARTSVSDFFHGVYKRFLVLGPQELTVKITREGSTNATLAGLFLDPCLVLLPIPTAPRRASRSRGEPLQRVTTPSGRVALPPNPSAPVGSSPQTAAVRDLLKSYESLRRAQTGKQTDLRASPLSSGDLAKLRDGIQASLSQDLPPPDRAAALWMLWQCQEQISAPSDAALSSLKQWTSAITQLHGRQRQVELLRTAADELFALGDLDASQLVCDSYVEALAQAGAASRKGAEDTVDDALKRIAFQYFTLNADSRYGLHKWQEYLNHLTSRGGKKQAIDRLRTAAKHTYKLAQDRHDQSRGADPSGYLLPIAALRQIRRRYSQGALSSDDQKQLASACKRRLFFLWGLDDYVQEYDTLVQHYPRASGRPDIYLEAIQAHLILAQRTNDYGRALKLAHTLSRKSPSSPQAASAQMLIISDYFLYREKYEEAEVALKALEKKAPLELKPEVAALRQRFFTTARRKLLSIPGTRKKRRTETSSPSLQPDAHESTIEDLVRTYESLRQRRATSAGSVRTLEAAAKSFLDTRPDVEDRVKARWILWQCQVHRGDGALHTFRRYLDDLRAACTRSRRLRILRDVDQQLFESRSFDALEITIDAQLDAVTRGRRSSTALAMLRRFALRYYTADAWRPYGANRWDSYICQVQDRYSRSKALRALRRAANEAASAERAKSRGRSPTDPDSPAIKLLQIIQSIYGDQALTAHERRRLSQLDTFNIQPSTSSSQRSTGKPGQFSSKIGH